MHSKMISLGLLALASTALARPHGQGKRSLFSWWNPDGVSECLAALPSDGNPSHAHGHGHYCNRPSASAAADAAPAVVPAADSVVAAAATSSSADDQDTSVVAVTDTSYVTNVQTVYVTPTPAAATSSAAAAATTLNTVVAVSSAIASTNTPVAPVAVVSPAVSSIQAPSGDAVSTVFAATVKPTVAAAVVVPSPVNNVYNPPSSSAAKPTTAAASPAAAATPAAAASGGKRGIPYNAANFATPFTGGKVSWAYNWGSSSGGLGSGFEYVPMLWGTGSHATNFAADANKAIAAGSKHLLAFNEPDHAQQANLDPQTAATAYKTLFSDPFSGKARLGAPAVTNGGGSMGLTWLGNFMKACTSCDIDFVPIHWYDSATNIQYFKDHVTQAHTLTGKPIWITEFGASGSDDQVKTFLQTVIPWMESQDWIERYSYFMAAEGLLCQNGGLSAYGKTYASL